MIFKLQIQLPVIHGFLETRHLQATHLHLQIQHTHIHQQLHILMSLAVQQLTAQVPLQLQILIQM